MPIYLEPLDCEEDSPWLGRQYIWGRNSKYKCDICVLSCTYDWQWPRGTWFHVEVVRSHIYLLLFYRTATAKLCWFLISKLFHIFMMCFHCS